MYKTFAVLEEEQTGRSTKIQVEELLKDYYLVTVTISRGYAIYHFCMRT